MSDKKKSSKKKKKEVAASPLRSKTFALELYPEWNEIYLNIIAYIKGFKHAYIVHDKDVNEETGELKKAHTHVVIMYGGRRTLTSVQNEFKKWGLEPRFVQTCNERAMLRYLIHKDNLEKYQYSREEIITNVPNRVEVALQDEMTAEIAFNMLNEYIYESGEYIPQYQFNKYAYENNLMIGLRRYSSALNNALREHNRRMENDIDRMNKTEFTQLLQVQLENQKRINKALENRNKKEEKERIFDEH